ncbi:MAG: aspartate aminotransferase family protein [Chloroflexota bacterium]
MTDAAERVYSERNRRSAELYARAQRVLPGGNSRTTVFFSPYPFYAVRGEGCRVWDADGHVRVDFLNNYTALILGHAHPKVVAAIAEAAARGTSFAAPTEYEIRLAEELCRRVKSVEQVRFTNSGTEATMLAVRAARAYTGRPKIAKFEGGYHGSHDYAAVSVGPDPDRAGPTDWPQPVPDGPGIPESILGTVVILPYNNLEAVSRILEREGKEVAAVIVEPLMGAGGAVPATVEFLRGLWELTRRLGIVLIFDEVIAFRLAYGGAQEYFGVEADLTTFGKIIGGGLPVGALGGRADIMGLFDPRRPDRIGHGGTFNANPVTMAAGLATLAELTPAAYEHLNRLGELARRRLWQAFERLELPAQVTGAGSVFAVHFTAEPVTDYRSARRGANPELLRRLHLGLLNEGVIIAPRGMGCISTPMTEAEVEFLGQAVEKALGGP